MKTHTVLAVAALAVVAAAAAASAENHCAPVFESQGASFNLGVLKLEDDHYSRDDANPAYDFQYYWNVCGVASKPPRHNGSCVGAAPAWQVYQNNGTSTCYRLGEGNRATGEIVWNSTRWSLINENDPTEGVKLTYLNGQKAGGCQHERSLTVNLLCKPLEDVPEADVSERDCDYKVEQVSSAACPLECERGSDLSVCSNHGRCEYDATAKRPRCMCNAGYFGSNCGRDHVIHKTTTACDGSCGAMIFLMLVLVVFIGLVFAAWYNTMRKHNGYIGTPGLAQGLIERDAEPMVREEPSAVAGGAAYGGETGSPGPYGADSHEVELDPDA